jgi:transposase
MNMRPYSVDLRERVVAAVKQGMKKTQVCRTYKICRQTLYSWLELDAEKGHLNQKTNYQKGHSHGIKDLEAFKSYVDAHPSQTQEEMAQHFNVGSSTIGRALLKIGYTRKKRAKFTQNEMKKNAINSKKKSS